MRLDEGIDVAAAHPAFCQQVAVQKHRREALDVLQLLQTQQDHRQRYEPSERLPGQQRLKGIPGKGHRRQRRDGEQCDERGVGQPVVLWIGLTKIHLQIVMPRDPLAVGKGLRRRLDVVFRLEGLGLGLGLGLRW